MFQEEQRQEQKVGSDAHEGELQPPSWRVSAPVILIPVALGAGQLSLLSSFFLSSKGSATGEFAGVFLACNQKIQFYD